MLYAQIHGRSVPIFCPAVKTNMANDCMQAYKTVTEIYHNAKAINRKILAATKC